MKKVKILALLGLSACMFSGFSGCASELDCPTGLMIDENYKLTWDVVDDARSYIVEVKDVGGNNHGGTTKRENYSLANLEEGDYEVRIKAVASASSGDKNSDWSFALAFHKDYETGCVYKLVNKTEYELVRAGTASGEIELEDVYRGKPVTSIAKNAFKNNAKITAIQIGENVKTIADQAFYNCKILKSVSIPDTVTSMGTSVFQGCAELTTVNIPKAITAIPDFTFAYCRALSEIEIGEQITSIGDSAFSNCAFTEFEIPDSITYVGPYAFSANDYLTNVTVGSGVETIDMGAFSANENLTSCQLEDSKVKVLSEGMFHGCSKLESVSLPEGLETIAERAFEKCGKLMEIEIPDGVSQVGLYAFKDAGLYTSEDSRDGTFIYADDWVIDYIKENDSTLTEIDKDSFSRNVVGIADYVFANAQALQEVLLPKNVRCIGDFTFFGAPQLTYFEVIDGCALEYIGEWAFANCENLTTLYLGSEDAKLKTIDNNAFYGCASLTNSTVYDIVPASVERIGSYAFKGSLLYNNPADNGLVYAGKWVVGYNYSVGDYTLAVNFSPKLKAETIGIADFAFYNNEYISSITGTRNIRHLGEGAFYGCTKLNSITLPRTLEKIEARTFMNCTALLQIAGEEESIPANLKEIGNRAFEGCASLMGLDISNGNVEKIGERAFYRCYNLKTLNLGSDLVSVGQRAFYDCASLENVTFPDSVQKIGDRAFYRCVNMKTLDLGEGVREIGRYAFYKCNSLEEIEIPDSVTMIGKSAFYKCENVLSVTLGKNLHTIEDYAFFGLNKVQTLEIPTGLTSVGKSAFNHWEGLSSVVIRENVTDMASNAFHGYKGTIYVEAKSKPEGWSDRWNSSQRPVVWGCTIAEDENGNAYVTSVTRTEDSLSYDMATSGIDAPVREGYTFVGWKTEATTSQPTYQAAQFAQIPVGTTVYAVWEPIAAQ